MPQIISFIILVVVLIIVVVANIKIVPQANAFVLERLGAYSSTWNTGLHVKLPFLDRIARKVSLKLTTYGSMPRKWSDSLMSAVVKAFCPLQGSSLEAISRN